MLRANRVRELLNYDPLTGLFTWRVWRGGSARKETVAGSVDSNGYIQLKIDGKLYQAHRVAWLLQRGKFPKFQLDHKNRIRNDNRISNLREATKLENTRNHSTFKNNTEKQTGIVYRKYCKKWRAYIYVDKKQYNLGHYSTLKEAREKRRIAENIFFNEFSPNFHEILLRI